MPYTIEFDAARKRIAILVAPPISEYDALECFRRSSRPPGVPGRLWDSHQFAGGGPLGKPHRGRAHRRGFGVPFPGT